MQALLIDDFSTSRHHERQVQGRVGTVLALPSLALEAVGALAKQVDHG